MSKEMYLVLRCFPRKLDCPIAFNTLLNVCSLSEDDILACLNETLFPEWNYVRSSAGFKAGSNLYLTESGLAKIEEYEQSRLNLRLARMTLLVSIIAICISFASFFITLLT